jgi:xanthine dehydrogenase accessory factor
MESRVIAEALEAIQLGEARLLHYEMTDPAKGDPGVCGGQLDVFVEPIQPSPTVVVAGAGHVGREVAHLAKWLDFRVVVTDDRPDFCTPESVPDGDEFIPGPLETLTSKMQITSQTYLILCTRNVKLDVMGLPSLLATPAAYIGVIGSRRRWATTRNMLLESGVDEADLSRVVSPMGLEINAETPKEIAVSILAEIIMLRRGGDGKRMTVQADPERSPKKKSRGSS